MKVDLQTWLMASVVLLALSGFFAYRAVRGLFTGQVEGMLYVAGPRFRIADPAGFYRLIAIYAGLSVPGMIMVAVLMYELA